MDDCELRIRDTIETDIEIFSDKLLEIAEKFENETAWKQLSYKAQWIAGKYTSNIGYDRFANSCPKEPRRYSS